MKIGVTGANGFLGRYLVKDGCTPINSNVMFLETLQNELADLSIDYVIHCAAISSVDECEKNQKLAFDTNVRGTANVVQATSFLRIPMAFMSTNQVFDGKVKSLKGYGENSKPSPINYYGLTKFAAESYIKVFGSKCTIIRTSKLFNEISVNKYFDINTIQELPTFLVRSYCHARIFMKMLLEYVHKQEYVPILNVASQNAVSEYEFAVTACRLYGEDSSHIRGRDFEMPGYSPRPHCGKLDIGLYARLINKNVQTVVENINYMFLEDK